ncbi:J domain-containing protein [Pedobacter helvus]|uniref:J domain-containing protein n=1 Tax=Pedobacter helvus TaxID=2563444 RepID=A0ABW9JKF8_9SPHI|nr:J domain-containing protein [Pedobacter ureilyticus]
MTGNYYDILGISQTATSDEVKKAYRKLSLKFHPDKNEGDEYFSQMFKQINIAYNVLIDTEKRKDYDFQLRGQSELKSNAERLKKLEDELAFKNSLLNRRKKVDEVLASHTTQQQARWSIKDEKPSVDFPIKIKHVKYSLWVVIIGLAWAIGSKGSETENDLNDKQSSYVKPKKKPKRKKKKTEIYRAETIDTTSLAKNEEKPIDTSTNFSDLKLQDTL